MGWGAAAIDKNGATRLEKTDRGAKLTILKNHENSSRKNDSVTKSESNLLTDDSTQKNTQRET